VCKITTEFTQFYHSKWNKSWISLERRFQWNNAISMFLKQVYMPFRETLKLSLRFLLLLAFLREEVVGSALFTQGSDSLISSIMNQINEIYTASYTHQVTRTGNLHAQHFIPLFWMWVACMYTFKSTKCYRMWWKLNAELYFSQ